MGSATTTTDHDEIRRWAEVRGRPEVVTHVSGLDNDEAGAGEGNRTLVVSLGSFCSAIELHPLGRLSI
jgi:hypothetical protein